MFKFSDYPLKRLQQLRELSEEEKSDIQSAITQNSPIKPWPYAMPGSVAPWVVTLGVSPGNSPSEEHKDRPGLRRAPGPPPTFGEPHRDFYYRDKKGFWDRIRALSCSFMRRDLPLIRNEDALSLCAHLNLGTVQAGNAGQQPFEDDIIRWVSSLLNLVFQPKILICLGLKGILKKNPSVAHLWNEGDGLKIDWSKPDFTQKFSKSDKYSFDLWVKIRSKSKGPMAIIMWPNHPVRHPFTGQQGYKVWKEAIDEASALLKVHGF